MLKTLLALAPSVLFIKLREFLALGLTKFLKETKKRRNQIVHSFQKQKETLFLNQRKMGQVQASTKFEALLKTEKKTSKSSGQSPLWRLMATQPLL